MINYLIFALLFIISVILAQIFLINLKAERYKKKNIKRIKTNENFFKYFFSKINLIKTKDDFLSKQGYPLKLNVISYFLLKISLSVCFYTAGLMNYRSIIVAVIFSIIGYFLIDIYIWSRKKSRDSEICSDLSRITNSICMQLAAEVSLKNSLKNQFENCKNKDFQKCFLEFATKYELSEFNIIESTKVLSQNFDILEIEMFCKALESYNESTQIEELLENLVQLLKKRELERVRQNTLTKILYITFGVIIALGNIVLIIFYPLFVNIGQGFNTIFR